jgi:multidrug resistance efflux pump
MQRLKRLLICICLLFLITIIAWCAKKPLDTVDKQDFAIQALSVDELSSIATREKVWSLLEQQQITVTAQVAGRVSTMPAKEWENVLSGQPVIQLADTVASYSLQVERSQNNLQRTIAQEAQTRLTLEDAIISAEAGLIQTQEALRIAQSSSNISVRTQELSAEQARIASESQLEGIQISFGSEYNTLRDLLVDVLDRGDSILGITNKYRWQNEEFRILLSAKDTQQKTIAESQLFALYTTLETINALDTDEVVGSLNIMLATYNQINTYLAQMQQVFINTVTAVNLPEAQLDGFVQTFAGLQTRTQAARAGFNAFRSQALNLLSDIDGTLAGTVSQESAALGLESTRLTSANAVINAELALANAERSYIQAQNNADKQSKILATQIQDAQLSYQDAMRQLAKLTVWSPVRGVLGEILVTPGQEVQPGTPLFSVIGTDNQLLQFTVHEKELPYLRVGQEVTITYNSEIISWSIQSVPRVANNTMQYRVLVSADRALPTFGWTATILIPVQSDYPLIPLASVAGVQAWQGIVHVLNANNEIEKISIALGDIRWSMVELRSPIADDHRIIINDVSSYDANDFVLQVE